MSTYRATISTDLGPEKARDLAIEEAKANGFDPIRVRNVEYAGRKVSNPLSDLFMLPTYLVDIDGDQIPEGELRAMGGNR